MIVAIVVAVLLVAAGLVYLKGRKPKSVSTSVPPVTTPAAGGPKAVPNPVVPPGTEAK